MEELIEKFGKPTHISQSTYTFPCPICRQEGEDSGGDNLKVSIKKKLITCFKSKAHTEELRSLKKDFNIKAAPAKKIERKIDAKQEAQLKKYLVKCQKNITKEHETLIAENRGLRIETLQDLKVGLDLDKQAWVFPVFQYPTNHLIGFEYRDIQMLPRKKGGSMWHEEGTFSCLAQINKRPPRMINGVKKGLLDNIVIVEGFLDAYLLYQYIEENDFVAPYQILTPSCGAYSIPDLVIKDLKIKSSYTLLLDNDKAGREVREVIKNNLKNNAGPNFFDIYIPEEYNDFGEYYKERLRKTNERKTNEL